MKKRILSLILALVMVIGTLPATAFAAEAGYWGAEDVTWTLENGVLTISGNGSMEDYYYDSFMGYSSAPWGDRVWEITAVVIEDGVTSIGDYAFYYCGEMTSVSIPDTVTSIGEYAFYECGLTSVEIPDSVTVIEPHAFECCFAMTSLKLSAGLTAIPEAAFSNCRALTSVTIPESVTSIGWLAFSDCGLTSLTIPDGVTSIGDSAFSACISLKTVNIPSGVTALGYGVFNSCGALESVTIPAGVTSIGNYVFGYCSGLKEITFVGDAPTFETSTFYNVTANVNYPAGNTTWTADKMQNYGGTLTWEAAAKGVTWSVEVNGTIEWSGEPSYTLIISGSGAMEDYLFDEVEQDWSYAPPWVEYQDCITKIVIEDGVTSIGNYALFGAALTEVVLPDSVTAVGDFAFSGSYGNWSLTTLKIGSGLQSIGRGAFRSCSSLTSITVDAANAAYCVRDNVLFSKDMSTLVLCPVGLWLTEYSIPDGVTAIADYAFDSNYNLETVSIPGSMKSIGDSAFASTWLTTLTLPDGLERIGNSAFEATSLTSVIIPDSVTTIGSNAFNISDLKSVQIGSGVNTIGNFAFGYGSYLETITVSDANTAFCVDEGALLSADKTELLKYPAKKEASGYEIPAGAVTIRDGAFSYAKNLTQITIPESVSEIGKEAFYYCEKLGSAAIPDHVKEISDYTFANCSSLAAVTLGSGVERIGVWAFASCSPLTEIVIPKSVKTIDKQAFISCGKLTSITFEGDAPAIASDAFYSVATVNPGGNTTCATGYYPANNATWTQDVLKNYGGGSSNSGILKWEAVDMGGGEEGGEGGEAADKEAPTVTGLTVEDEICSGGTFTTITVTAADNVGVDKVVLTYAPKGGSDVALATVTQADDDGKYYAKWTYSGLSDGAYTITAVAYDIAGNQSQSATVDVIVDNVKPVLTALKAVNADGGTLFGGKYDTVFLSVSGTGIGSGDTVTVSYPVVVDGDERTAYLEFAAGETGRLDISGWESGTYTFGAEICDAQNNTDTLEQNVVITVDNTVPPAPTNLFATAGALKNTLSWNRSTEADARSAVYRAQSETGERTLLTVVDNDDVNQSYLDTAVAVGVTYYYWVTAQDALGNESAAIASGGVTTVADTTLPGSRPFLR